MNPSRASLAALEMTPDPRWTGLTWCQLDFC